MEIRRYPHTILMMVFFFLITNNCFAATISIDLDLNTPGIQSSSDLGVGNELSFEVVFTGDGATQFDTFAIDVVSNNPAFTLHSPVAGDMADSAPLLALDIYSAQPVQSGDALTPGGFSPPLGYEGGLSGVGIASVAGLPFSLLGEGETLGLFRGSLSASDSNDGTLSLFGFPFGVGAELSLAGASVPVNLQQAMVNVVPLPPAVLLFVTGVVALLGIGRRALPARSTLKLSRGGLLLTLALFSPLGFSAADSQADLDGDLIVTSRDISKLASCFAQDPQSSEACRLADVDEDGDIDRDDFSFVSARMGQSFPWLLYPLPQYILPQVNGLSGLYTFATADLNNDGTLDTVAAGDAGISITLFLEDGRVQSTKHIASGGIVYSVAVGDVNADGRLDLIIFIEEIDDYVQKISTLFGNGDGSFGDPQEIEFSGYPYSLALGDMNNDGNLDLLVTKLFADGVSVLLGSGDGSFQPQQFFSTGGYPEAMTLSDLNGDGCLDVVSVNDEISVLLGNGDGTLQAQQRFPVGNNPVSLAISDMNSDGWLDVVAVNSGDNADDGDISVLLGNGDGTLQAQQRFPVGNNPVSLAIGDMDADGWLDVVVGNSAGISLLLGNGDGDLQAQQSFSTGEAATSITLQDINGDGALDIGVVSGRIGVLYGNGDGYFQEYKLMVPADRRTGSGKFHDFNGDGLLDIVFKDNGGVSLRFGDGEGGFSARQQVDAGGRLVEMTDLNGDGWADALILNTDTLSVLLGKGDGSFQSLSQRYTIGQLLGVVDMNGDGELDVVAIGSGHLSVLLGEGDGSFQEPVLTLTDIDGASLGDMNNDGVLDVFGVTGPTLVVLLGDVDGAFSEMQRDRLLPWEWSMLSLIGLADINGDKMLDAMVYEYTFGISLLFGSENGTVQGQLGTLSVEPARTRFLGDLNGDGRSDLVMSEYVPGHTYNALKLWLGGADGNFHVSLRLREEINSRVIFGDLNGDGFKDMVLGRSPDEYFSDLIPNFSVSLGSASGHFSEVSNFHVRSDPHSMQLVELNGDGLLDMVFFSQGTGNIIVMLGNGDGSFQPQQPFQIDNPVESMFLNDVNGDNKLDVVFGHGEDFTVMLNQSGI